MRGTLRLEIDATFYVESCYTCGIPFAITVDFQRHLLDAGRRATFYCPNGHAQCYVESTATQLQKAEALRRQAEEEAARLLAHNDALLADLAVKTKTIKSMERRAKAGVCQFCRRQFANVARHMTTKHPEEP